MQGRLVVLIDLDRREGEAGHIGLTVASEQPREVWAALRVARGDHAIVPGGSACEARVRGAPAVDHPHAHAGLGIHHIELLSVDPRGVNRKIDAF